MTTNDAIGEVQSELAASDTDLYVYAPEDEDYFIGEAILIGTAIYLLTAFLDGVKAAAKEQLEGWGKNVGNWFFRKVRGLFGEEAEAVNQSDVESASDQAKEALAAAGTPLTPELQSSVKEVLQRTLVEQQIPEERAEAIITAVVSQGAALLGSSG